MQRRAVSMTPKNREFGECSELQKRGVFDLRVDLKLNKLECFFFFQGGIQRIIIQKI